MKTKLQLIIVLLCCATTTQLCAQSTLRKALKKQFLIGTALDEQQITEQASKESKLIKKQFSSIVAENCMKCEPIHPERNRYNFSLSDRFVQFGEKNKMAIIGHCLIWHSQLPAWFCSDGKGGNASPDTLKARMREHIHAVVGRYKGRIHGWDVVNEAIEDDGSFRKSKFYQILGEDFIRLAFQYAHEADPNAELYYNDYSMSNPRKYQAAIRLAQKLRAAGCRIDAIGMQGHMTMESPSLSEYEKAITDIGNAGFKVMITEWDLSALPDPFGGDGADVARNEKYRKEMNPYPNGLPDSVATKWNKKVIDMFNLFLKKRDVITRVTFWGLNDKQSWRNNFPIRGRTDYALFFDRNNQPKTVITDMIKAAKSTK